MSFKFVMAASIAAVALGYTGGVMTGHNAEPSSESLRVMRPLFPAPIMPADHRAKGRELDAKTTKNSGGAAGEPKV